MYYFNTKYQFLFCELLIILDIFSCIEHHKAAAVICHVESAVT